MVEPADPDAATVLVVVGDATLAGAYETWLSARYRVRTATDGRTALGLLDDVDVVLVGRDLPDGDDLVERIRRERPGRRVSMVTDVEPDVPEPGVDDYLIGPVDREDLLATVDRLLDRAAYDETVREYFATVRERERLRERADGTESAAGEAVDDLDGAIADLERRADGLAATFDDGDFRALFRNLDATAAPDDD